MNHLVALLISGCITLFALNSSADVVNQGPQSAIKHDPGMAAEYPRIVLYSVSWCPHCKEAKEYLTSHNIPFINRDVEMDESARKELLEKYKTDRVPLIVLGNDEKIIKGFSKEDFEKILKVLRKKGK